MLDKETESDESYEEAEESGYDSNKEYEQERKEEDGLPEGDSSS